MRVCLGGTFFLLTTLVNGCNVREKGTGKGEAERDREEVDGVVEIERGPY